MPELTLRSLVRNGWAGKSALSFLAFALALGLLQPTLAQTNAPKKLPSREVRGMVIFKIPFGAMDPDQLVPEIGFSLSVRRPEDELYKPERFDLRTGAKLPDFDLDRAPTWSLRELEPLAKRLFTPWPGQSAPYENPAGPNARIRGLSKYGLPVSPDK